MPVIHKPGVKNPSKKQPSTKTRRRPVRRPPLESISTRSAEVKPRDRSGEALKVAGVGVVIGGLIGVVAGRSERRALAGGVAGGAIALVVNEMVRDQGLGPTSLALAVRQSWDLTREVFARMVGYSPRTIAGYEAGSALGAVPIRRYTEMQRLRLALDQVMKTEFVSVWLNSPNPAFEGSSPLQIIERGEVDRVWASVYYLDSGMS